MTLSIVRERLENYPNNEWLFQSESPRNNRRLASKPINRRSVARVFEDVGKSIAPKVQLGTHSMRKTRGYAMHTSGRSIEEICKVLNHSHPAITMRYIGLTQDQIDRSFTEFEL